MKKLMTMLAAVATAFGLYAADDTGTSFEGVTAEGTLADNVGVIKELPDFEPTTLTYWANLDDTAVIKARDVAFADRPSQYDGKSNLYCLELATGTKVIERYAKDNGGATRITDGNLFFDSVVNMTAFEDEPTIPQDAKIAVWLQEALDEETQDPVATNLVITINGENYIADGDNSSLLENWARVTVKALKLGNGKIGFVVFVNSVMVTCRDLDDDMTGYNANAKKYAGMKALFPFAGTDTTITAAGFAGKGSIDDLVFTETAPDFDYAGDFAFCTIEGATGIKSFEVAGTTWNKGDDALEVEVVNGEVAVVDITADDGFFMPTGSEEKTFTEVKDGDPLTVEGAKALGATVVINDVPTYYENAAAALEALNVAGEITATLVLNAETSDAITIDNADLTLTLDLAGKKIVQGEAEAAINVNAGALTIIDSEGDGVVTANPEMEDAAAAVLAWGGTLAITDGKYDGLVAGSEIVISGGAFLASANDKDTLQAFVTDPDAELVEKEGYFVLETVTDFTVEVPDAKENTTLVVQINGGTPSTEGGKYTVPKDGTLTAVYTADEGYELEGQGEWTIDYDTKDTEITAPTAKQIMVDFTVAEVEGAELKSVEIDGEEVKDVEGKYTVPTNSTVTLTYEAKPGYRLTKTTAQVQITDADQEVDVSDEIAPAEIDYVAEVVVTVSEGVEETNKFETAEAALLAVQVAEQAGQFPIWVKALADEGLTITSEGNTAKIAKDVTIGINKELDKELWVVDGNLEYSGTIDGKVDADEITMPQGTTTIALGVNAIVTVKEGTALTKASFTAPAGYKVKKEEFESGASFVQFSVEQKTYVAQIGDDGEKFETFAEAVAAVADGQTIKLLKDCQAAKGEDLLIKADNVTLDLNDCTLTHAEVAGDLTFGVASGKTLTVTNGTISMTSGANGFAIGTNATAYIYCKMEKLSISNPVLDIYGGKVYCNELTDLSGKADIFRFKEVDLTSEVYVSGGKYKTTATGKTSSIFHHYKNNHTAKIEITGGEFDFGSYLIDAYQRSGDAIGPKVNFTKLDASNAARFTKDVLVSNADGSVITEANVIAEGCKTKMVDEKWYQIAKIQYWTVTIADVERCTIAVTNGETEVTTGAQFDQDLTTVLKVTRTPAEGYKLAAGYLDYEEITLCSDTNITAEVVAEGPEPVNPGETVPVAVSILDPVDPCSLVQVKRPNLLVEAAVDAKTYDGYFKKTAFPIGAQGAYEFYQVTVEGLKPEILKAATETEATLTEVLKLTEAGNITLTAEQVKPGLYYSLKQGEKVDNRTEGTRALATQEGVTLQAGKWTNSGFYQVLVNWAETDAPAAQDE